jgi:hypothetical protein
MLSGFKAIHDNHHIIHEYRVVENIATAFTASFSISTFLLILESSTTNNMKFLLLDHC